MKRVVIPALESFVLEDVATPVPGSGEVLVKSVVAGVCGSDVHAAAGTHPFVDFPFYPGHEAAGTVETIGPDVDDFAPGDRVLIEPNIGCGECEHCTNGADNLCEKQECIGYWPPGAMADAFIVPAANLIRVPADLDWTQATMVEPLSTGAHAVRVAGADLSGRSAVVLGAGPIGMLTMLAAKAAGADPIVVTDPLEWKRKLAVELGATAAVDGSAPDALEQVRANLGKPDVVFDCVSVQATMDQAFGMVAWGGTVVVVGVPRGPVSIPLPDLQAQEVQVRGCNMYTMEDFERSIALIQSGAAPVDRLVTAQYPLAQVAEAFAAAKSGEHLKVHLRLDGESSASHE